ncbi:MAG: glycoside hydrolase family 3 protein [bacterium]|nr:glycoside hydrolase family 3 protein [bacterium]
MKKPKLRPRHKTRNRRLYRFKRPLPYVLFVGLLALFGIGYIQKPFVENLPEIPSNADYKQAGLPIENRVDDLLSRMSLSEKIGQMSLVDKNSLIKLEDISRYKLGAILSGAGAKPKDNTPAGWTDMVGSYQEEAAKSRLAIPLLYGLDANHGHSNIPGATIFPHAIGLGASGDSDLVERVASATAEELADTGVNWSYSPSLDAPKDIRWGRVYEAFSDDPETISRLGSAYINGIQKQAVNSEKPTIMATAKHYLATGALNWGESDNKNFKIDQGKVTSDEALLESEYLPPYKAAVDSGVASIMVGLQKWDKKSIITDKYLITDKLKDDLGFKGFVVSDWYGVYERAGNKYTATVNAINAGLDVAMLPYDYKGFERDVTKAVSKGDVEVSRIDDAVKRILTAKFKAGLFDKTNEIDPDHKVIGSLNNRLIAREAATKSAVLLKNNGVLPISDDKSVLVVGSGADNIGRQSGAWTVEWQGIDGNWLPGATSIFKGMSETSRNSKVVYASNEEFNQNTRMDVGVAIVSEKPYAEGWGDTEKPRISEEDLEAIEFAQSHTDKFIVVVVSGRPLFLDENKLATWDGLVAAWLPGSEGAGIADVLFGKQPFTAKLPLPWPATIYQLPISSTGVTADKTPPLFPRGFSAQ